MAYANKWAFKEQHTQADDGLISGVGAGNFISAESVVLCAGPPMKDSAGPVTLDRLIPIGLCDSVSIQQNKNIIQLFEIGSRLPFLLPGRTISQVQLNRVVFNGDSLMGALTKGAAKDEMTPTVESMDDSPGSYVSGAEGSNAEQRGRFFMNLASSFFAAPFGLALLFQDSDTPTGSVGRGQWVSGLYIENCMIQSHQMSIQGQQYIIMESAMVRTTGIVPLDITT